MVGHGQVTIRTKSTVTRHNVISCGQKIALWDCSAQQAHTLTLGFTNQSDATICLTAIASGEQNGIMGLNTTDTCAPLSN